MSTSWQALSPLLIDGHVHDLQPDGFSFGTGATTSAISHRSITR